MMMKNVVSGNNLALKKVALLTYIQGNFSDCKLIASIQKSVPTIIHFDMKSQAVVQ